MFCNTVSATSACHLSEMTRGKFLYNSWSASVSLMPKENVLNEKFSIKLLHVLAPFVSSSSKEPISKASAALTSPRGGINGGGYFCWYTTFQSMPSKNGCSLSSSAPLPRQPTRLSMSLYTKRINTVYNALLNPMLYTWSRPSRRSRNACENVSGNSTFIVSVIRSISCLSLVLCCRKGLWPLRSL